MAFLLSDVFKRDAVESCPSADRAKSFLIRDILSNGPKMTVAATDADVVHSGVNGDVSSLLVTTTDRCTVDRRQPFNALSSLFIPSHLHHHHHHHQQQQQQQLAVPLAPAFQQPQTTHYLLPASNGDNKYCYLRSVVINVILFHDLLRPPICHHHTVCGVITAHNFTPVKRDD